MTRFPRVLLPPRATGTRWSSVSSSGGNFFVAVVTDSLPEQILEVGRFAQFARFGAFAFDVALVALDFDPVVHAVSAPGPVS